ncbi:uncharacterized protein LOC134238703 [Saccostrea cucullata]|uniref:uncharacterized protein LOC134238703 n=1 Tax=Saccostrea cuccullata TaxID=36930 RepID=UPI002ED3DF8A
MDFFGRFHTNSTADTQNMSAYVFILLRQKFGSSLEVSARREVMDLTNTLANQMRKKCDQSCMMISGSKREGFRLMKSDVDIMYWTDNYRVIWEVHESQYYNNLSKELILSDGSESPPGFTLLYLFSPILNREIQRACVKMKNRHYISSSKYKAIKCSEELQKSNLHGPCVNRFHGMLEYDFAHCFASKIWPPSASSWKERSHSWPPQHVRNDIIKSGCHFVAIGHKLGRHDHEPNEWRISFSLAEQKLVHIMNHAQFLTYGLLKLFLDKIINTRLGDYDKLLCSYHMKTAVFWAIQQNTISKWYSHTLLDCSWICFKIILKWVYEGVCPNFFIPSNNMFLGNIYGEGQHVLFTRLYEFYEMGIKVMLETLSITTCDVCIQLMCDPRIFYCADEDTQLSETDFDVNLLREVEQQGSFSVSNVQECIQLFNIIEQTISSSLTECQAFMLQIITKSVLQNLVFMSHIDIHTKENKLKYRADKKFRYILKPAAKFGCISDMLYVAMYHYKTFRYREALDLIDVIKVKLAQPYVMKSFLNEDEEMFTEVVGDQSWSTKMRKAVAWNIKLNNNIFFLRELRPEQQSSLENGVPCLYIPPFVMLYMLEIFCCRQFDFKRAQKALGNLRALVHYDQRQHIPPIAKNIAWQILGICQQMTGDLQDALASYQQSLREDQLHSIQSATESRIHKLHPWNDAAIQLLKKSPLNKYGIQFIFTYCDIV